ncbi:MAG: IclR family transcriptional regulator [Rubrivivax sp.]
MPTSRSTIQNNEKGAGAAAAAGPARAQRGRSGINSGLDLLESLAASATGLTMTELARQVGMAKSSVHQLLASLAARGYVRRAADQRFHIGVKAWEVGCRATVVEIGRVAEPYMAELVREVDEGVALGVLDGGHVVCIQIAESAQVVRVHNRVGERNPAHCLSNGLAMLSLLDDEEVLARLPRKLEKLTPRTIDRRSELLAELKRVREQGYAVCRGSWRLDVAGVAVAVRGADGRAAAGVSIALPVERLTAAHLKRIAAGLLKAAAGIEAQLGHPAGEAAAAPPPRAARRARALA